MLCRNALKNETKEELKLEGVRGVCLLQYSAQSQAYVAQGFYLSLVLLDFKMHGINIAKPHATML